MSCSNWLKPLWEIAIDYNWCVWAEYWRKNGRYTSNIILQHDNTRPNVTKRVKTYSKTLKWEVLAHSSYSLNIASSDYHLFQSMAHGLAEYFYFYKDTKKMGRLVVRLKRRVVVLTGSKNVARKIGKSSGSRLTLLSVTCSLLIFENKHYFSWK